MANKTASEEFRAELIKKFPFTRVDYITEYVSMCEQFASQQTTSIIEEVERVRNAYIEKSDLKISNTKKGYGSSKAYAYNEFAMALDELITKLKK